jgi:RNA polymerase sigma-70 factor (ECF subfamily)
MCNDLRQNLTRRAETLVSSGAGVRSIVVETPEHAREAQTSAELIRRIGAGDRRAEEELVRRYHRGLVYLVRRRTHDSELALDVAQDTLRITIEKLRQGPIEQAERLGAYLRGTAINLASAQARKSARRATTADSDAVDLAADQSAGPFDRVSSEQVQRVVRALLGELPVQRDREILIRTYLRDEDKSAICEALRIDSAHYNRVLFRAKQRFKELLMTAAGRGRLRAVE